MKKIKISFAAMAFALAIGGAFATHATTATETPCITPDNRVIDSDDCSPETPLCCTAGGGTRQYFGVELQ